jgi:hypothetical protein
MSEFGNLGKMLVLFGLLLMGIGGAMWLLGGLSGKTPWMIGRLPGDIYIERGNFRFYFPLATSILVSILLTVILSLLTRR